MQGQDRAGDRNGRDGRQLPAAATHGAGRDRGGAHCPGPFGEPLSTTADTAAPQLVS